MAKFKLEPEAEVSGVYPNGEPWSVKADKNGDIATTDEQIAARLDELASLDGHPLKAVKG